MHYWGCRGQSAQALGGGRQQEGKLGVGAWDKKQGAGHLTPLLDASPRPAPLPEQCGDEFKMARQ